MVTIRYGYDKSRIKIFENLMFEIICRTRSPCRSQSTTAELSSARLCYNFVNNSVIDIDGYNILRQIIIAFEQMIRNEGLFTSWQSLISTRYSMLRM